MCLAFEKWEQKATMNGGRNGIAIGEKTGSANERRQIVLSMHHKRISSKDIAYLCDIPYEKVEEIVSEAR